MLTWLSIQSSAFAQDGDVPSMVKTQDGGKSNSVSADEADPVVETQQDALEARLLGELPSDTMINAPYESNEMVGIVWILPVFVFMVALIVWSKIRKTAPVNPGEIRVVSQTPLGKEGSIAIIVVGEEDGAEQKMLVGLSENGAPRLLSVLDAKWTQSAQGSESMDAMADFDQFLSQVPPASSDAPSESEQHLENRKDLVDELLTARGINEYQRNTGADSSEGSQTTAVQPYSATSFADANFGEEEESVVDDDPWVVNFRRKYNQS